jgi:FixJ family two-component response regulator
VAAVRWRSSDDAGNFSANRFVVDDDPSVVKALARLLRHAGWNVETYESAEAFLARPDPRRPGCLVLDVSLPGSTALNCSGASPNRDKRCPSSS